MRLAALAAAALSLAACEGAIGTIDVEIVTAPGADPLADVTTVRLTLDEPSKVVEAERDAGGGFTLELEVTAEGTSGFLTFEGLDANGDVIAWGRSGALPIAAIDALIKIYVAAPDSLAEAPVTLDPARSEIGAALLPYGVLWAGGRAADGAPLDAVTIYNVYTHGFQEGDPLPEPRAGLSAGSGATNYVYFIGGFDADGELRGEGWQFDTQTPPAGIYIELRGEHLVSGAPLALVGFNGSDVMLAPGTTGAVIDGLARDIEPVAGDAPALDGIPLTLVFDEIAVETLIAGSGAGSGGAVLLENGSWFDLAAPADADRDGHGVVSLPNADALIVGGGDTGGLLASAVRYRRADRTFQVIDDFLATPRRDAAIARAGNRIVVAGGIDADGVLLDDAEVFDAQSLEPVSVLPLLAPRTGADAASLGNGQVIVAGGVDADGAPVATLELYTP